jgi:GxxExxY protein
MTLDPCDPLTTLTKRINGAAIAVHRLLGPGLLESAYQACLEYELALRRISFERQVSVPIIYRGVQIDCGYRLDLLVEGCVVVEVKSVERLGPIHSAQMITYLKLRECPVGLVLNFNVTSMRQGIRRLTNRSIDASASGSPDLPDEEVPAS